MVEKIKTNKHGDCIYSEQDAINLLYTDPDFDITKLFFDSTEKYNNTVQELGLDLPKIHKVPERSDVVEFDKANSDRWHMPEHYSKLNVLQWLLEKCQNDEERFRVQTEYSLFEEKKFIKVLQFLIYFV